jgi:hypothetical protein
MPLVSHGIAAIGAPNGKRSRELENDSSPLFLHESEEPSTYPFPDRCGTLDDHICGLSLAQPLERVDSDRLALGRIRELCTFVAERVRPACVTFTPFESTPISLVDLRKS